MEEVLVPIALFAIVPVIIFIVSSNGRKRAADLQITVQKAIEKGVELTPETIRALGVKPKSPYSDLRAGVLWLAVAAAILVLGISILLGTNIQSVEPVAAAFPGLIGVAFFPGFIGIAFLILHFQLKDKQE